MMNWELEERFAFLVKSERKITREILELICEVERRKIYLEQLKPLGLRHSRLTVVLEDQDADGLQRAKELLSHTCQTWAEVVAWLVRDYLKRKDLINKR